MALGGRQLRQARVDGVQTGTPIVLGFALTKHIQVRSV
jgi:hypothetical protein